ncbi:hypothetical protein KFE25_011526 [Diacronema lutheri]|uniref:SHOCT domain-containing protein n=1 Tax=Diacronema lutheri TaxID=2081491 RepID=A0A8J5XAX5_DIALT|nr:hypothetical protein KFE25_011526 [Diacronema lutheri]
MLSSRSARGVRVAFSRGFAEAASGGDKRLHSTDIAFKPTEGGWGFNSSFANGYDRIFAKAAPAAAKASLSEQINALDVALKLGALTQHEYDQAAAGARQRAAK